VENIRDGLTRPIRAVLKGLSPHAEGLHHPAQEVSTLSLAGQLKPFQGKTFVAFHDFAPYFAERHSVLKASTWWTARDESHPAESAAVTRSWSAPVAGPCSLEPQEGNRSFNLALAPGIWK